MKKRSILALLLATALMLGGCASAPAAQESAPELDPVILEQDTESLPPALEEDEVFLDDEVVPLSELPDTEEPSGEPEPEAEPEPVNPYEGLDETQIKYLEDVLAAVNKERANKGLSELVLNPELCKAAQVRAKECTTLFSHTRPNGELYKTAIAEAGVVSNYTGENVAMGYTSGQHVMQGWMKSEGHKANILNEKFTMIGIGLVKNDSSSRYKGYSWAQLFAR